MLAYIIFYSTCANICKLLFVLYSYMKNKRKSIFGNKHSTSMPTYVIIEKRDFENLFETVEANGDDITAVNVKTSHSSKKRSRVPLHRSGDTPKSRTSPKCSPTRRKTKRRRTYTDVEYTEPGRPASPATSKPESNSGSGAISTSNSQPDTGDRTGPICRSEGVGFTSSSESE